MRSILRQPNPNFAIAKFGFNDSCFIACVFIGIFVKIIFEMRSKILGLIVLLVVGGYVYNTFINKPKPSDESQSALPAATIAQLNTTGAIGKSWDTSNYCEGLEFYNGKLYTSAGRTGLSFLAIIDPVSGKEINKRKMPADIFAEGMTILNGTLYQLTYQNGKVLTYDPATLNPKGEMPWKYGEGWGLTNNGKELIASNGTHVIYFLNPSDMTAVRSINVFMNGGMVNQINELEFVDGYIYANQFTTDLVYKINATNGQVEAVGDFKKLLPEYSAAAVAMKGEANNENEKFFNGIAYNKDTKSFWLTGKNWPKIFEIKF